MIQRRIAALATALLILAGCVVGAGSGGQIEGIQWVLDSYLQAGTLAIAPETVFADATFESSRVTGQGGCNSYTALYQAGGRSLRVSQSSSTLMACPVPVMDFEQTYLQLLQSSRYYTARNDQLTVFNSDGTPVLVYDAAPNNPLLGRWDVDSYLVPPSTVKARAARERRSTWSSASPASAGRPVATRSTGRTGRTATPSASAPSPRRGSPARRT